MSSDGNQRFVAMLVEAGALSADSADAGGVGTANKAPAPAACALAHAQSIAAAKGGGGGRRQRQRDVFGMAVRVVIRLAEKYFDRVDPNALLDQVGLETYPKHIVPFRPSKAGYLYKYSLV